jgi:putative phosphoribosyl transferase
LPGQIIKFPISNTNSNLYIEGNLVIPDNPIGIVVFAHGSGSTKNSLRNQMVSEKLNDSHIATLLFDLLSVEEQDYDTKLENMEVKVPGATLNKFNIKLLTKRLSMVTKWIVNHPSTSKLHVGYFASSTGAAAALISASRYKIVSIVIRSGRVDLVENEFLDKITSTCLFIVGSKEKLLVKVGNETLRKMRNSKEKKLYIVKGASHLFEEQEAMEEVSEIAAQWMVRNFISANNSEIK